MYIYRVVDEYKYMSSNYLNDGEHGVNSFEYEEGEEYVHFFVLPESAEIYQQDIEKNVGINTLILKCEVPYDLLKDNFGIGMYEWYGTVKDPVLEVRLKKSDFNNDMIVGISHQMQPHWKNKKIYARYLENVVDPVKHPLNVDSNKDVMSQMSSKPIVDPRFNFLNYFPNDQLQREGLRNSYCHYNEYDEVKVDSASKSFKDKLKALFSKRSK